MNTAVDDGLIRRNPCRIKGAGNEDSPERPVLTVRQVYALADAVDPRYRALILLATFASLRWAELAALTPHDIDLEACTVRVPARSTIRLAAAIRRAAQVTRWSARRRLPRPDRARPARAPRRARSHCGTRLPQPGWPAAPSRQLLPPRLDPRSPLPAWQEPTFTTCATPGTSSPPTRARTPES